MKNIFLFIIFIMSVLLLYKKFVYHRINFFDRNIIFSKLIISLIITAFMAIFFQKMYYSLIYEETKETNILVQATNKKSEMAEGNEILLRYIEIDGKRFDAYDYIVEGNWLYYCGGAHWKTYDLEKTISDSIKLKIPRGFKKNLIFQSNKWRGIVRVTYNDKEKDIDLYEDVTEEDNEISVGLNDNSFLEQYDMYILYFFIL